MMIWRAGTGILAVLACVTGVWAEDAGISQQDLQFFERRIRPLLSQHCYECHSAAAETVHGGLQLDSAAAIRRGGDSGPLIADETLHDSLLLQVVQYGGDIEMPPEGRLADAEIQLLTEWVRRKAPLPPDRDVAADPEAGIDFDAGREFWSFQPVSQQPLPQVQDSNWPRNRIDQFLLAKMEAAGLTPSPQADRVTLIRRLTFDLTGLPPTNAQVAEFVADESPDAWPRLIDRLLSSPQYGERWARLWLDMARYTDRTASWLDQAGEAYLYRDWVVQAFNDDMPYDEFIHRQLATDLMPETGPQDLPALGFISLSPTYWKELKLPSEIIKVIVADEWEERVDAVSQTFLGLTVACARCHDHKFDPISSEDYYALAGVFASCRSIGRPVISEQQYAPVRDAKQQVEELEAQIAKLKQADPVPDAQLAELRTRIQTIQQQTPFYDTPLASAVVEESLYVERAGETAQQGTRLDYRPGPRDLPVYVRGDPNRPADIVPRRFLTVLAADPKPFQQGSGRLELAQAMTNQAASLVARVIVNRIWLAHFGRGLVTTPSNFGRQGQPPSHPELLDDLAARFIESGWSIKELHRQILTSAAWQQTSQVEASQIAADPDNRWLARATQRRLDFESWRDAMLSVSGQLDLQPGGPSVELDDPQNHRRTLYATVHRRELSTTLQIHDFPDPNQHSAMRTATTTALQGLYALNGPLLLQQAQALAARLQSDRPDDDAAKVEHAYQLLFNRSATVREQQLASQFLGDAAAAERATRWTQYAHLLLASNEFLFLD